MLSKPVSFWLCLLKADTDIKLGILQCPPSISATLGCLSKDKWHTNAGWQATLNAYFQNANVAYSRTNGTVLSHDFAHNAARPANTPAHEMLVALQDALGDFKDVDFQGLLAALMNPDKIKIFPLYVYPAYIWSHLESSNNLASQDPAQVYRGAETLQSLLAIILYFWYGCQISKVFMLLLMR
jgi:hypothetical protein